jgi:hypothetical protein
LFASSDYEQGDAIRGVEVTADQFRKLALSLPESSEVGHMGHPDFRVGGKIFATLGYPDDGWAMVKLSALDQMLLVQAEPEVFVPVKGSWGKRGATNVRLRGAKKAGVRQALASAWRNTAPKHLVDECDLDGTG